MQEYAKKNFKKALQLPMPNKTFAKLKATDDYVALIVRPGLINKHLTSDQLMVLANLEKSGDVKYSAGHSFIVTVHRSHVEQAMEKLTEVNLYVASQTPSALFKCCDFCDGDLLDGLPLAKDLLEQVEQMPLKNRVRIGFNACTQACYNAVQDDLALIFHNGKVDIYGGAIPMGRRASSGHLLLKKVPENQVIDLVKNILGKYNASSIDKFSAFVHKNKTYFDQLLEGGLYDNLEFKSNAASSVNL